MKEFWNERYNTKENIYGDIPNDFLVFASSQIPPQAKILCLAEGEGRNALYLAKQGHDVSAVDFSEVGINKLKAQAKLQKINIHAEVADLNEYDIGQNKWDVIVAIFSHLPPLLREKVHHNAALGLKDNGLFIMEAYHPLQLNFKTGGPQKIEMLYSADILKADFKNLKIVLAKELEREINEGQGHAGPSYVVQFIAKKIEENNKLSI